MYCEAVQLNAEGNFVALKYKEKRLYKLFSQLGSNFGYHMITNMNISFLIEDILGLFDTLYAFVTLSHFDYINGHCALIILHVITQLLFSSLM